MLPRITCRHVHPHTKLELRFNSQTPVKNVTLQIRMQVPDNSVETIRYDYIQFQLGNICSKAFESHIELLLHWRETHPPEPSPYLSSELRKYFKHFNRIKNYQGVFYRKFFDDTGKTVARQYVGPAHFRTEFQYRVPKCKTTGHIGITKTAQISKQKFVFRNL